ncbi:hypothetical protein [Sphingomonas sp. C3-2]|uniref:hypothetical protein n=1 Tax=Sphingomonas sp. C3-2 TaxID=3062169 RepID=UPI00294B64D7|nr:hypothetical protein [Sphingomonas sp. C3-2]WOK35944.1 hypothetical protein QYC26_13160 [Sphingomonas sp. C3-2]
MGQQHCPSRSGEIAPHGLARRGAACAVVEIVAGADGVLPTELVRTVYRASAEGLYVLALHGIDPVAIDHALDALVGTLPLNIPGVIYVDAGDEASLRCALGMTECILATSFAFKTWVAALGFDCHADAERARGLNGLAAPGIEPLFVDGEAGALRLGGLAAYPAQEEAAAIRTEFH